MNGLLRNINQEEAEDDSHYITGFFPIFKLRKHYFQHLLVTKTQLSGFQIKKE